jgi:hypothetical protein
MKKTEGQKSCDTVSLKQQSFSSFRTQYTNYFFVAEYYGLRNHTSWGSRDLASALLIAYQHFYFKMRKVFDLDLESVNGFC